jgi:uncharacterized protein
MFIDVNKLGVEGVAFDQRFRLPETAEPGPDGVVVGQVRIRGDASLGERGVGLTATLEAELQLACGRCLESFDSPVSCKFSLVLITEPIQVEAAETQLTEQDLDLFHAEGGKAHLPTIAAEQVYLNLPLKPICKEDCQGLCPTCGANRNRLECGCPSENLDPRLAPLLDLKKRLGDN